MVFRLVREVANQYLPQPGRKLAARLALELLEVALRGSTDEETCQVLGMKLSAIKKRWAALFHHIAKIKPELLPGTDDGDRQTRGPQKRHRLLAYLREHPEELRPVVRSRRPQ